MELTLVCRKTDTEKLVKLNVFVFEIYREKIQRKIALGFVLAKIVGGTDDVKNDWGPGLIRLLVPKYLHKTAAIAQSYSNSKNLKTHKFNSLT